MAQFCFTCGRDFEGWQCPRCAVTDALAEQTRVAERAIEQQRAQADELAELQRELAQQERELAEEHAAQAAQHAEDIADALREAAEEQRFNVANAWALQSQAMTKEASELLRAGMSEASLAQAQKALDLDRGNLEAHAVAQAAYLELGQTGQAAAHRTALVKLLRTSRYRNAASLLFVLGNLPAGSAEERDAIAQSSEIEDGSDRQWHVLITAMGARGYRDHAAAAWSAHFQETTRLADAALGIGLEGRDAVATLDRLLAARPPAG